MGCCHPHSLPQEYHGGTKRYRIKNILNNKGPSIDPLLPIFKVGE